MTPFADVLTAAQRRAGGSDAVEARLPAHKSADELRIIADDRYLSLMSLRVFQAGFKHSVVSDKWPAFEEVFLGFEPGAVRGMSDEVLESLMGETRIVRHGGKIKATRDNAAAMCLLAEEKGGFGPYIADWPGEDLVGLWADIGKRFSQMGGNSAPAFLRMAGKDSFVLTDDVVRALETYADFTGNPKGKRDQAKIQEIFNAWAAESGRPLGHISVILALS